MATACSDDGGATAPADETTVGESTGSLPSSDSGPATAGPSSTSASPETDSSSADTAADSSGETPADMGSPVEELGYPRLAGMLIGNPKSYDNPEYQAQIARLDMAVLGIYFGWAPNGVTPAQAVAEIHALNPDILLANYTVMTEVSSDENNPSPAALRDKLYGEIGPGGVGDWWAYDANGEHSQWTDAFGAWDTNLTSWTTPDENGDSWPQWLAGADHERVIGGVGLDIWYCDNNFWRPRVDADWNRDGIEDDRDDPEVRDWYRDGQRAYYDRAKELEPGMLIMLNADSDLSGEVHPTDADPFDQYKDVAHIALMEHAMGASWSNETWAGWAPMMAWYRSLRTNLLAPAIVVLEIEVESPTSYRDLRYGLASTLLDDGYFAVSWNGYHEILWFDEFDLAGTSTTKWLGQPIDPPPTEAFQDGVFLRRFEHGVVLVNPKGNGEQTIAIEAGYHRIAGEQAPEVNDGTPVTNVTLADRDALLLVAD